MTAQIPCVHCATRAEYEAEDLHLSLLPVDEGVQILRFACLNCGRPNSQTIGFEYAERLTDMGVSTAVVAVSAELDENLELRQGPPLTRGYVDTWSAMSIGQLNRAFTRFLTEGNSHA